MELPKFLKCPECDEKYENEKKRRIIDSCGHPRCFSCLVLDNQCTVCKTILGRRRSWISSRDSLLSTDDDHDGNKSERGSTYELFSKEQYLRTLYSYDPESQGQEHVYSRRGSFDLHTGRIERQINLRRHSSSALVLPNEIQKASINSGINPISRNSDDPRRNFLLAFPRKISADIPIFNSSSSSVTSSNERVIEDENSGSSLDSSDSSQMVSPRSSGYWSEVGCYSDQEGHRSQSGNTDMDKDSDKKENNPVDEDKKRNQVREAKKRNRFRKEMASIKKTNEDINELAKIDFVLSGPSCAWQNTRALFPSRNSCCVPQSRDIQPMAIPVRYSKPDWQLRKYFERHSNNIRHSSLKVTNL